MSMGGECERHRFVGAKRSKKQQPRERNIQTWLGESSRSNRFTMCIFANQISWLERRWKAEFHGSSKLCLPKPIRNRMGGRSSWNSNIGLFYWIFRIFISNIFYCISGWEGREANFQAMLNARAKDASWKFYISQLVALWFYSAFSNITLWISHNIVVIKPRATSAPEIVHKRFHLWYRWCAKLISIRAASTNTISIRYEAPRKRISQISIRQ